MERGDTTVRPYFLESQHTPPPLCIAPPTPPGTGPLSGTSHWVKRRSGACFSALQLDLLLLTGLQIPYFPKSRGAGS